MSNFGIIKNTYNNILSNNIANKNDKNKNLFKKYIKLIKENDILNKQFNIYYNIENASFKDKLDALTFLNENLSLINEDDIKSLPKFNKLLESNLSNIKLVDDIDSNLNSLYESLNYLLSNKKTSKNVTQIHENKMCVVNYLLNNNNDNNPILNEKFDLPNTMLLTLIGSKFNEEYKNLTESEIKIINNVVFGTDNDKESLFKTTLTECLVLINENLLDCDLEIKEKLLEAKETLLNKEFNIETYDVDINKLIKLKDNLSN